jgi:hypothetical protein
VNVIVHQAKSMQIKSIRLFLFKHRFQKALFVRIAIKNILFFVSTKHDMIIPAGTFGSLMPWHITTLPAIYSNSLPIMDALVKACESSPYLLPVYLFRHENRPLVYPRTVPLSIPLSIVYMSQFV